MKKYHIDKDNIELLAFFSISFFFSFLFGYLLTSDKADRENYTFKQLPFSSSERLYFSMIN